MSWYTLVYQLINMNNNNNMNIIWWLLNHLTVTQLCVTVRFIEHGVGIVLIISITVAYPNCIYLLIIMNLLLILKLKLFIQYNKIGQLWMHFLSGTTTLYGNLEAIHQKIETGIDF